MFYLRNKNGYWRHGIVPYDLSNFPDQALVRSAMEYIEEATDKLIRFADVSSNKKNIRSWLTFEVKGQNFAPVGRRPGNNPVELRNDNAAAKRIAIHEICHKLGLGHEHQAPVRDQYIIIHPENIGVKEKEEQFHIKTSGLIFEEPYDFESITHYNAYDFSRSSNLKVIEIKDSNNFKYYNTMGSKDTLSDGDLNALKKMYKT